MSQHTHQTKNKTTHQPPTTTPRASTPERDDLTAYPQHIDATAILRLQRTIGNQATQSFLQRANVQLASALTSTLPGIINRKKLTDHNEKIQYNAVLTAASTKSKTKGTSNTITVNGIPGDTGQKTRAAIAYVKKLNDALRAGIINDLWDDKDAGSWIRTLHKNDENWLPALQNPDGQSGNTVEDAWANYYQEYNSQYAEVTVDSNWRLVYDFVNDNVYMTLHYDNDGTHSPFFHITDAAV